MQVQQTVYNHFALLNIRMGAKHLDLVTLFILREYFLGNLGMVLAYQTAGRLDYGLRGTVVLLQFEQF